MYCNATLKIGGIMDRVMTDDDGEVVLREAQGPGYEAGPAVVATGPATLDAALRRERNFTIEGRGEEVPAPRQAVGRDFVAGTVEEVRREADRSRREAADATGRSHSSMEVLEERLRETLAPMIGQNITPETAVEINRRIDETLDARPANDMLLTYDMDIRQHLDNAIADEIVNDARTQLLNALEVPAQYHNAGTPNYAQPGVERVGYYHVGEPEPTTTATTTTTTAGTYVTPGINVRQDDITYFRADTHTPQAYADPVPPQGVPVGVDWAQLTAPQLIIPPTEYYCPQCERNITNTFTISLHVDAAGNEEKYQWCSRCLCKALHQLVPKVRPYQHTVRT
jgi:hypothetical protein